ncbi:hypothetical protein CVS40_11687 [Lucilia cuprina]|nr:hypothetical protein CVS40_11687 [Lucilia cuprina]
MDMYPLVLIKSFGKEKNEDIINVIHEPANSRACSQSDIDLFNRGLKKVNTAIEEISSNVSLLNMKISGQIRNPLTTIPNTLSTLVNQVKELTDKDIQKEVRITNVETHMNKMEEQMISRNI